MKYQALSIMLSISVLVFGSAGFILSKIIADPNSNIKIAERFVIQVINDSSLNAQEAKFSYVPEIALQESPLPICDSTLPFVNKEVSLVNYLKKNNIDSDYESRILLAEHMGISDYSGSAADNRLLQDKVQIELANQNNCRI